jgi:hypothetical protein
MWLTRKCDGADNVVVRKRVQRFASVSVPYFAADC